MTAPQTIKAFPSLDLRSLVACLKEPDPVLGGSGVSFYASGRAALFHIFQGLHLGGADRVLLPSFHCGVEVEAALRAGAKVGFYRINKDLTGDLDHLLGSIDEYTRAVVVIHYFGFPQDISRLKEVCRERGLVLIEDCAHALYSQGVDGEWLGMKGDFAVFSMRKTVFLPNGGAVRVNRKKAAVPAAAKKHFELSIVKSSVKSVLEHEAGRGGAASAVSRWVLSSHGRHGANGAQAGQPEQPADNRWYYDVPLYHYEHDISAVSKLLWGRDHAREIITSRRKNYLQLVQMLTGNLKYAVVFPQLPEGVCPLCLPIFSDQRDLMVSRLIEKGIEPFVFGRMLHPLLADHAFPVAHYLADSIIGLPVHQQLSARDMKAVSDILLQTLIT